MGNGKNACSPSLSVRGPLGRRFASGWKKPRDDLKKKPHPGAAIACIGEKRLRASSQAFLFAIE